MDSKLKSRFFSATTGKFPGNTSNYALADNITKSQDSIVGAPTILRTGEPRARIPPERRIFSLFQKVQSVFRVKQDSYLVGEGEQSNRREHLTTLLHLVAKIRINGAIPLRPLYTCMA